MLLVRTGCSYGAALAEVLLSCLCWLVLLRLSCLVTDASYRCS